MKDIVCGDGLLVGDRVRVRGAGEGVVEGLPMSNRRMYSVRLESGELVEREWLQIDLVCPASGRKYGGNQSDASKGDPIEWDAHLALSGCSRIPPKKVLT